MLISSSAFTQNSTVSLNVGNLTPPEEPLPLDLQLPDALEIKKDGVTYYAWNIEGYATILQIFNGYTLWADSYIDESEQDSLLEIRLEICEKNKDLEKQNFQLAINHRDRLYELWYADQTDYKKEKNLNVFKTVLIATGTGVVGIAAGIVFGFLAAK